MVKARCSRKQVYKIRWKNGMETAERYSSKGFAQRVLRESNFPKEGTVVKAKLEPGQRGAPFTMYEYRTKKTTKYPRGRPLLWFATKEKDGCVFRQHVKGR